MYRIEGDQQLILASGSPRRKEMLSEIGLVFQVVAPDLDETVRSDESPREAVQRLAVEKALTVAAAYPNAWVIGADTAVVVDSHFLGKPVDGVEARRMLRLLSGRDHVVWGAFAVVNGNREIRSVHTTETKVSMAPLTEEAITAYVETGEPFDKAGAYAIQGLAAHIVERVEGSYTNVVGLDISLLLRMLEQFGVVRVGVSDEEYH